MSFSVNRDIVATSIVAPTMETGSFTAFPDGTITFNGEVIASGIPPTRLGQPVTNITLEIPSGSPPPPPPYTYTFTEDDFGDSLTSALFILSGTIELDTVVNPVYRIVLQSSAIKASALATLDARGSLVNSDVSISDNVQSITPPSGPIFTNPDGEITIEISKPSTETTTSNFTIYANITNTQE